MKLLAKKSLGQHFLHSPSVLSKIIDAAHLQERETVLEIGPGTGILTEALLKRGVGLIAIEKDSRALEGLREKFKSEIGTGQLNLIEGDVLGIEFESSYIPTPYAIVANIPYYITGAILEQFLEHEPRPEKMILLVQKEVAERIVARDGKESILSISVKAFGRATVVDKVPRGAFSPPPNVDSAILAIEHISDRLFLEKNLDIRHFFTIVRAGFAHKRKYLLRNLEITSSLDVLKKVFSEAGLDEKARAEDIPVEKWIEIAAHIRAK